MRKQDNHRDHDQYTHSLFYKKYINLLGLLFIAIIVFFPLASLLLPDTKPL